MELLKALIMIFACVSIGSGLAYNTLQLVKSYKLERKLRQAEEDEKRLENLEARIAVNEELFDERFAQLHTYVHSVMAQEVNRTSVLAELAYEGVFKVLIESEDCSDDTWNRKI